MMMKYKIIFMDSAYLRIRKWLISLLFSKLIKDLECEKMFNVTNQASVTEEHDIKHLWDKAEYIIQK